MQLTKLPWPIKAGIGSGVFLFLLTFGVAIASNEKPAYGKILILTALGGTGSGLITTAFATIADERQLPPVAQPPASDVEPPPPMPGRGELLSSPIEIVRAALGGGSVEDQIRQLTVYTGASHPCTPDSLALLYEKAAEVIGRDPQKLAALSHQAANRELGEEAISHEIELPTVPRSPQTAQDVVFSQTAVEEELEDVWEEMPPPPTTPAPPQVRESAFGGMPL